MGVIPQNAQPVAASAAAGSVADESAGVRASDTIVELHHRDCLEGMAELRENGVDVVVTSPPYNLGIKYGCHQDNEPSEQYLEWSERWGREVARLLQPNGSLFVVVGSSPANPLLPHQLAMRFSEFLVLQNQITWIKSITLDGDGKEVVSRGHFKPINSRRFLNDCHETILHFTHTGHVAIDRLAVGVPYADQSNIKRWQHTAGRDRRCRGNVWFIPYETIQCRGRQRPHPATFPVELAERCIRLHGCNEQTVVLDPFVGIGSTAVAALNCGAGRVIGFDIDDGYLAVAAERIESPVQPLQH